MWNFFLVTNTASLSNGFISCERGEEEERGVADSGGKGERLAGGWKKKMADVSPGVAICDGFFRIHPLVSMSGLL